MHIEFTGKSARCEGGVSFQALVDGKSVSCRVSEEALQDHCGANADGTNLEEAYVRNRGRIDAAAEGKLRAGDSAPLISSADL